MDNLRNKLKKINIAGQLDFNEPLHLHTTFKTGGPADIYCAPSDTGELTKIMNAVSECSVPHFILGGGANVLISDSGYRGIVIDTRNLNSISFSDEVLMTCGAGTVVDDAAEAALQAGLSGFDAFYGMPGTVGGAVWMNARCYGLSVSDLLVSVKYLDEQRSFHVIEAADSFFEYKKSPFQGRDTVILEASFRLKPADRETISSTMRKNRADRESKGHYAGPSAGSVFKNNRDFGKPSGAIIDSLGLRGTRIGGAMISESHANIFLNTGSASSADIYRLIRFTADMVFQAYGYRLEPEVQFIGDFAGM